MVPDGRAEAAGILVGDKLVEINGRNVLNTEHEIVASLLRNDILIGHCKKLRVVDGTYNCSGDKYQIKGNFEIIKKWLSLHYIDILLFRDMKG